MFARTEVRVLQEKDGVIYDSDNSEILHAYDRLAFHIVLAITPCGHYFQAILRHGLLGPNASVHPIRFKAVAIYWAAKGNAPDKIMEELGVKIIEQIDSNEPYNFMSSEVIYPDRGRFGWRALMRNYDGRFWMLKTFDINALGIHIKRSRPISQRKGIAWAITKGAPVERLKFLGVEDPNVYQRMG